MVWSCENILDAIGYFLKQIQPHYAQLAHALQRQPIFLQLLMALLPKSSNSSAAVALLHESRLDLVTFAGREMVPRQPHTVATYNDRLGAHFVSTATGCLMVI